MPATTAPSVHGRADFDRTTCLIVQRVALLRLSETGAPPITTSPPIVIPGSTLFARERASLDVTTAPLSYSTRDDTCVAVTRLSRVK